MDVPKCSLLNTFLIFEIYYYISFLNKNFILKFLMYLRDIMYLVSIIHSMNYAAIN